MNSPYPIQIVISGGHTGGHFFPAMSFAQWFKKIHPEVEINLLLGRIPTFANALISTSEFKTRLIKIPRFPAFFPLEMISFLLKYNFAYIRTFVFLLSLKPSLVVGFGSYASVPSVMCAAMLGIPILLHEQNVLAGRANRILSWFVNRIAISFPETRGINRKNKMVLTGYPLREEFLNLAPVDLADGQKSSFKILVFGGSQGAQRLNRIFLETINQFDAEEKKELAVKHIVGNEDLNQIKQQYEQFGIRAEVSSFSYHIAEDYRSADLIISRSGAGTVFELIATGRPAILIPYPHAYAHQQLNAEYLAKHHAAVLILEENLSVAQLSERILDLKHNPEQRAQLAANLRSLNQSNAAQNLVQLAWEIACRKN